MICDSANNFYGDLKAECNGNNAQTSTSTSGGTTQTLDEVTLLTDLSLASNYDCAAACLVNFDVTSRILGNGGGAVCADGYVSYIRVSGCDYVGAYPVVSDVCLFFLGSFVRSFVRLSECGCLGVLSLLLYKK